MIIDAKYRFANKKEVEKEDVKLRDALMAEARTLRSILFKDKAEKIITIAFHNEETGEAEFTSVDVPKRTKSNEPFLYRELLDVTTDCIAKKASVFVRSFDGDPGDESVRQRIYAFRINPFGAWEPVSAKEVEMAGRTMPSGEVLPREKNVFYLEKKRTVKNA